jgi:hypothetical protein
MAHKHSLVRIHFNHRPIEVLLAEASIDHNRFQTVPQQVSIAPQTQEEFKVQAIRSEDFRLVSSWKMN